MHPTTPDYELAATLPADGPDVHAALSDPRRRRILALLLERAATARQLAESVERSPQAVTHHLDVLRDAGLVRVVRTRRVRATEQRWWGRTARVFLIGGGEGSSDHGPHGVGMLREAVAEVAAAHDAGVAGGPRTTIRFARIPADRAEDWFQRLAELADDFATQPRAGEVVHGMVVGVFPTAWTPLTGPDVEEGDADPLDEDGAG